TSANLAAFLHIIDTSRLLEVLREDNRAIFRAAGAASKAAEWLLARHRETQAAVAGIEEPTSTADPASTVEQERKAA
ncbi:MAG: hypothetical protein AABZ76_23170, partial [Pseudomonadota bacterium]